MNTGALIVINKDRLSQQLTEGAKGGGGGGGDGGLEVREEFADLAYWRADLVSDENGVIAFDVDAARQPDHLAADGQGVTPRHAVGEAINEIVATKELQVRPLLPRFFTAGDRAVIGGIVLNGGEASRSKTATFALEISGASVRWRAGAGETVRSRAGAGRVRPSSTSRLRVDSTASSGRR